MARNALGVACHTQHLTAATGAPKQTHPVLRQVLYSSDPREYCACIHSTVYGLRSFLREGGIRQLTVCCIPLGKRELVLQNKLGRGRGAGRWTPLPFVVSGHARVGSARLPLD